MSQITIFFDGQCPLCVREMRALKRYDDHNLIALIDINSDQMADYPDIDPAEAQRIILAYNNRNQLIRGLDVLHQAWRLVGKGWIYAPTRWPLIKTLADQCYLLFAKHRYTISRWLIGQSRCDNNQCGR
ncbi:DUF393 domain-containing protein [Vibrio sp. H11]|uniref:thiol-disulfide oxidoreductase DCC family protein n=1 Tax=Vibrio sp. H11 TaxID=2565928 RepID=UPI0010A60A85|nr:DUF393 domain-containing protein [Vibrio sp. H11]